MKGSIAEVGPYRIDEEIGRGGMATVYRGVRRSPHGTEHPVAIKVLDPELAADAGLVEAFHAEADLARRLGHRVLVPVLDHGSVEGVHYMAMELLDGETLSALRRRYGRRVKGFPVGHALYVMAEVLDGLHSAHELEDENGRPENVVHRDVSPRNIIITRQGGVRLLDFGIARFHSRSGTTQVGIVKGTVPYMPPEQALAQPLDRRADVFAVGVILHELLTGHSPIPDGNTEAQRLALATMQVVPDWKKIHMSLRPALEKALAPRAEDRWTNAAEFASALRLALAAVDPDHDPFILGGLVEGLKKRDAPKPANDDMEPQDAPARSRRKRPVAAGEWARDAVKEHVASLDLEGPIPSIPVPQVLGFWGAAIFLAALCYTFLNGIR